jgi:hypothetical protein
MGTRFNLVALLCASASAAVVAVSAAFAGPDCPPRYAVELACGITCATIWMSPQAINARGDIVGYAFGSCNLNDRAMVWYAGSPAVQALSTPSGTVWSRAYGISDAGRLEQRGGGVNDLGQAAGFGFGPFLTPNGSSCITRYGFFWNGAEMVPLGFMLGCPWMNPNGINNAGQISGNQNSQGGPAFCRAFLCITPLTE